MTKLKAHMDMETSQRDPRLNTGWKRCWGLPPQHVFPYSIEALCRCFLLVILSLSTACFLMDHQFNEFQQPVGPAVVNWSPPAWPGRDTLNGRYCRLELLNAQLHGDALYAAIAAEPDDASWTYMAYGPFSQRAEYQQWLVQYAGQDDPQFYAIVDSQSQQPLGVAAYLRVMPASGSVEVGHIYYSPKLRRTRMATEAMWLMMQHVFCLGYRRYEWKCDALNAPSRAAAERLGFTFEGIFRQATVVKGRNRDTAWYAMIDRDWPGIAAAYQQWLAPENFDEQGQQKQKLWSAVA